MYVPLLGSKRLLMSFYTYKKIIINNNTQKIMEGMIANKAQKLNYKELVN